MKIALNVMFALATLACVLVGALYLKSRESDGYVKIYSNEYL